MYFKVIVIGQIDGETTTFWFNDQIEEKTAVAKARALWIKNWHGEPKEIRVERLF